MKAGIFYRISVPNFKPVSTFVKCQLGKTKSLWPGNQHPLLKTGWETTSDHYTHSWEIWEVRCQSDQVGFFGGELYLVGFYLAILHTQVSVGLQSHGAAGWKPPSNQVASFGSKG